MTNEEAIKIIKQYDVNFCESDGKPISAELLAQAFDMAIKALEQEPCDDYISRQAVIDTILESKSSFKNNLARRFFIDKIKDLHSITPKEKIGHWIIDIKDMDYCFCSGCKHRFDVDYLKLSWDKYEFPPHCPNCGAKMQEVEDRNDDT